MRQRACQTCKNVKMTEKNLRIKMTEKNYYLTISANCPDCECEYTGLIINASGDDKFILIECIVKIIIRMWNIIKRDLKGSKRIETATQLVEGNMLPSTWSRKKIYKIMELCDPEPACLFSDNVLR